MVFMSTKIVIQQPHGNPGAFRHPAPQRDWPCDRRAFTNVSEPVRLAGSLRLRDGLPIIDRKGPECIKGALP
jgi:hypothetical protein